MSGSSEQQRSSSGITIVVAVLLSTLLFIMATHVHFTQEQMNTNTYYIRQDVPITFYRKGELRKALPPEGWLSDSTDAGMRVFRLHPDEQRDFQIDLDKIRTTIRVKKVLEDCPINHSWVRCPLEHYQTSLADGSSTDIFMSEHSNMFGSSAELDQDIMDYLETKIKLPFQLDRERFDQTFISNFQNRMLTTKVHSNSVDHSLAVQLAGRKTWIFVTADDYIKGSGSRSTCTLGYCLPPETMFYWTYKSQPGDLLYFPPHYAHIVSTEPGPNVMVNFHKFFQDQMLRRPIIFDDTPRKLMVDAGTSKAVEEDMTSFRHVECQDDSEMNHYKILAKLLNEAAESIP